MAQKNTNKAMRACATHDEDRFVSDFGFRGLEHHIRRLRPQRHTELPTPSALAGHSGMRAVLNVNGAREERAEAVIKEGLEAAFNFRRDLFLWRMADQMKKCEKKKVFQLEQQLRAAAACVDKLPPGSKGKLNETLKALSWDQFDTEMFIFIVETTLFALNSVSPECKAEDVREKLVNVSSALLRAPAARRKKAPKTLEPEFVSRTAPPCVIELWENLPVCRQVEAEIRRRTGTKNSRTNLSEFLRHAADLLGAQQFIKLREAPLQTYLDSIRSATEGLGLSYKPSYDWRIGKDRERELPAFAQSALAAVGAERQISRRQQKIFLARKQAEGKPLKSNA